MAETVRCRYVTGKLDEIEIEDLNEFVTPGAALEQRLVKVGGRVYVRKYVSRAAGARNPRLYDLLDREIRAGTRIAQVYPDRHPPELPHLVAYNIDADEPFVLFLDYTGEPAVSQVSRLDEVQRKRFEHGLLRAVQLASAAHVVHGAVSMDTVRWGNGQLQLVDFESAERVGEPRHAGRGVTDERDDLWGTGHLIRQLHLGAAPADRTRDPQRLRELLDPVFNYPPEQWPTVAHLLVAVRADNHLPLAVNPESGLARGHSLFDRVSDRKRGGPVAPPPPPPPPDGSKRFFGRFR